jgi:hypothetical protein
MPVMSEGVRSISLHIVHVDPRACPAAPASAQTRTLAGMSQIRVWRIEKLIEGAKMDGTLGCLCLGHRQ